MPEGASVTYAKGVMVEARPDGSLPAIAIWPARDGSGTPVTWHDDSAMTYAYLGAQHPRTRSRRALSAEWLSDLIDRPALALELSGVFALIVVDKVRGRVRLFGDRLAVQSLHHGVDAHGTWRASTHLMWLLLANRHDGRVDERGFFSHMAFGYGVDPHRDVYRGIHTLPPAGHFSIDGARTTQGVYWRAPEPSPMQRLEDVEALVSALQTGMTDQVNAEQPLIGLTAGKDSLCLASVAPTTLSPKTGTLGVAACADQVQAASIARTLGWPHVSGGVCRGDALWAWSDYIALHSAGLATVSYADMAAFVASHVPERSTFVMGEGGERVRDFFRSDQRPALDRLVTDYMTPADYLRGTLAPSHMSALDGYPHRLVSDLRATAETRDDEHFVSHFYRFQRMAGNFSLRNAVLCSIRPKLSPFLDSAFVDAAYGVSLADHRDSAIHRRIIAHARPSLLPYFDNPVTAPVSTQEWPARLPAIVGELSARFDDLCRYADDVVNPVGVQHLCAEAARGAGRSIYHLFRLYSFVAAQRLLREGATERLLAIPVERLTSAATTTHEVR